MECTKCGFANPEQARFCAGCGVGITAIQCAHCHTDNDPGSRFCVSCGQSLAQSSNGVNSANSPVERRMLTVMFCDLVDSTALVSSQDPEITRSFIREYQGIAKEVIENFGGRITEYLGDGIVAQFTRHETNAERAISAALQVIKLLSQRELSAGEIHQKASVRCGIATGLAVVGDMLGDEEIRSSSAIGLPLNLAARIQGLAGENQVVIGGTTHQLARGLFKFESLGKYKLKGIDDEQAVWRVVAKQSISSRFVAHAAEMTPMVDRQEVMGQLMEHWEQCKAGDAEAIVFWGEAGIGKSRIVQEFIKKVAAECAFVEYQCSPYHTHTALYPLISGVEAAARFQHGDSNEIRLRKLERLVRWSSDNFEHDMPALVNLLSLSAEDKWPTPNLSPDEIKDWIFTAAINNLVSLSSRKPLLIQLEDVHWIDPTTLELIRRLVQELVGHPVLLLITSRPGYENYFSQYPHVSTLKVKRLPRNYMKELVNQIKGESRLLDPVLDAMIERTDGIPLFMEELSKSLLESSGSNNSESNTLALKDIPATLHDSLLSRLDHLPDDSRSIALLASVIGRDFSYDLLENIADVGDKNLYELLSPLLEAQLVIQRKAPPNAAFAFKHAMVRDVAYETLLQSDRVNIHRKIARSLEQHYPDILRRSPELVARHYTEAKCGNKAIEYWLAAGKKAGQKFALAEARTHLTLGLDLLNGQPDTEQNKIIKLEYLVTLGPVLMALEGSGAETTRSNYARAIALCEQLPESEKHFAAFWGQWHIHMDYDSEQESVWAERLQQLAERLDKDDLKLQAHHCHWATCFHQADYDKAYDHLNKGIALYDIDLYRHHSSMYGGHDPKVCALVFLSWVEWMLGNYHQAEASLEQCAALAEELDHKGTHIHVIEMSLLLAHYQHDPQRARKLTKELAQLCKHLDLPEYEGKLMCCQGIVFTLQGKLTKGITLLKKGLREIHSVGTLEDVPVYTEYLAYALGEANKASEGLEYLDDLLDRLKGQNIRYWHAEIFRQKGELHSRMGEEELALTFLLKSLELAQQQKALSLMLRSTLSLYRYNQKTGAYKDSLAGLETMVKRFANTQNSLELKEARSYLQSESD